jgi:hypothetical protein
MRFGAYGMPLGLSLTGDLFIESTIAVAVAAAYQRETDWHERRARVLTSSGVPSSETRRRPILSGSR